MSSSAGKKQAPRLARPAARYWKGKAPKGLKDVESDSDAEENEEVGEDEQTNVPMDEIEGDDEQMEEFNIKAREDQAPKTKMNVALRDVKLSKEGKVIVAGREESGKTEMETAAVSEEEEESGEEESEEEGEEESSEESSSEEEEEQPQFRPVFVPKRARITVAEREAIAQDTEEALRRREEEVEERRKQSHAMVADSIKRELAEKEKEEEVPDVDDTDGLDPTTEFEAWRLRELARIKKEKEEEVAREKEREEIERRRALPEEQRLKEDMERANKLREEKPKGKQKFLQKYWHKGAFHQDDEVLKKHDYTEATESTVDVTMLPKVMQVRDFGKRSRTKYTHLVDQDTTIKSGGFGGIAPVKQGGSSTEQGGCFLCGGPHMKRDCPQNNPSGRPTGAAPPFGRPDGRSDDGYRQRDDGYRPRDDGHRPRDDGYRPRDAGPRSQDDGYKQRDSWKRDDEQRPRRRSRERSWERDSRDKRRRVD